MTQKTLYQLVLRCSRVVCHKVIKQEKIDSKFETQTAEIGIQSKIGGFVAFEILVRDNTSESCQMFQGNYLEVI